MELVPLRVRIGLRQGGGHLYPPFNKIPSSLRGGVDWCHFVDRFGGWHYDKISGHEHDDAISPAGQWLGLLLVPENFAEAAAGRFDTCDILTDSEAEEFYESRVTANDPEVINDLEVLQAVAAKRAAGLPEDDDDREALDPASDRPGRRRNPRKRWADRKRAAGHTVSDDAVKRVRGKAKAMRKDRERGGRD